MSSSPRTIDLGAGRTVEVQRLEPDRGETKIRIDLMVQGQRSGNRLVLGTVHATQLARHVLSLTTDQETAR